MLGSLAPPPFFYLVRIARKSTSKDVAPKTYWVKGLEDKPNAPKRRRKAGLRGRQPQLTQAGRQVETLSGAQRRKCMTCTFGAGRLLVHTNGPVPCGKSAGPARPLRNEGRNETAVEARAGDVTGLEASKEGLQACHHPLLSAYKHPDGQVGGRLEGDVRHWTLVTHPDG